MGSFSFIQTQDWVCGRLFKQLGLHSPLWGCGETGATWLSNKLWDCFSGRIFNMAANSSPKQSHNALWQPSRPGPPRNLKVANTIHTLAFLRWALSMRTFFSLLHHGSRHSSTSMTSCYFSDIAWDQLTQFRQRTVLGHRQPGYVRG